MESGQSLYDTDFLEWTKVQAERLRRAPEAGVNYPVDWTNVAEEIEDMGISEVRGLESRISTIVEHLLKLRFSQALPRRAGWKRTIIRDRAAIEKILNASPSLRRRLEEAVAAETELGRRLAAVSLSEFGERLPDQVPSYTVSEVLGDWFPAEPGEPEAR